MREAAEREQRPGVRRVSHALQEKDKEWKGGQGGYWEQVSASSFIPTMPHSEQLAYAATTSTKIETQPFCQSTDLLSSSYVPGAGENSENETNKMPLLLELLFFLGEAENEHISAQIYPVCILHTLWLHA